MKIKELWGILEPDTRVIIWNRKNGEEFVGYPDEMNDEFMDYRIVNITPAFQDSEKMLRIRATK